MTFPAQGQVTRKMIPFDDVIMQKDGYSSKHRESENKSYRLPILERRTMTPSKRCLLLVIYLKCHPQQEWYGITSRLFAIWNQCRSLPAKNCLLISDTDNIPHTWHTKLTAKDDHNNNKRKSKVDRVVHGGRISNRSFTIVYIGSMANPTHLPFSYNGGDGANDQSHSILDSQNNAQRYSGMRIMPDISTHFVL